MLNKDSHILFDECNLAIRYDIGIFKRFIISNQNVKFEEIGFL
jgi:hypothetical protein